MEHPAQLEYRNVLRRMQEQDWPGAAAACQHLTASHAEFAPGFLAASQIAARLGRTAEALSRIEVAIRLEPDNARFHVQRAHCFAAANLWPDAFAAAAKAESLASSDPAVLDAVATLYSRGADQVRALAIYDRAVALAPDDPALRFNRATARRFVGDFVGAEADYDRVIDCRPRDFEAYRNRSELRTQTASQNHVAELERALAHARPDPLGEVHLRYALAKELEDLGRFAASFEQLRAGASLRRRQLRYDVASDVATVDWIINAFPRRAPVVNPESSEDAPIFIVGLPRSGTTLVDRILGSHSMVQSAGELNDFALALVAAATRGGDGRRPGREELVARSASVDFPALGRDYIQRARPAAAGKRRFTDKMPLNYLYCGLIHRALPKARIVHVTRHPMAACYAMYKTLFGDAYPFSYDLADIGAYYLGYRRLMAHWRDSLPGVIHEVSYEQLVADLPGTARALLGYCQLDWEDACSQPERNAAATTTASAVQVRRPVYRSSVSQWRHYETELAGLQAQLEQAGVAID